MLKVKTYKKIFCKAVLLVCGLMLHLGLLAQFTPAAVWQKQWAASWIMFPGTQPAGYGVYYFRKDIELKELPATYPVHVSADNRYKLLVNERLVSAGPARSDLLHWNAETVDLAPFLHQGHNIVAAQVWNEGEGRPEANLSLRTGFILQGATEEAQALNTNASWKCQQDSGYAPIRVTIPTFYVAGPGEQVDMRRQVQGWEKSTFDDHQWPAAKTIAPGYPKNKMGFGGPNGWLLVPSPLPQMERTIQRLATLRKAEGLAVPASFPATATAITIPAHTKAALLLDQSFLTNAYLKLVCSGGRNGSISLGYAEALFTKYPAKGNRDTVEGKHFMGKKDSLILNGSEHQEFTTLSWRTFRYLQLNISSGETPLVLEDIYGIFTGYPFTLNARLETNDAGMQQLLQTGWRTARLCAVETYMDCPYYEQLQYAGDTRIQALVSLYNAGDDRLVRNAINQIDYSRQPEGITQSRYPTTTPQYIPPFSLWYIGMLHDYLMYGKDTAFIKGKLAGARQILDYFRGFQQADGSLKDLPWWNFTDWVTVPQWPVGSRATGSDGRSALMDLQLLWAYELAADMEQRVGMKDFAGIYRERTAALKKIIREKYWDDKRELFADRTEKDLFSQHANALAILTGMVSGKQAAGIGQRLLSDNTLAPASIYFKYYLHQALVMAGLGNGYLNWLDKWRENLSMGLTTWAEISDVNTARSDCHAWGASPNIELFRTVLGIDSDAPAFTKVKIEPHLGTLTQIGGEMPHPRGKIKVHYQLTNGHLKATIELPAGITGRFLWQGKYYSLKENRNDIVI